MKWKPLLLLSLLASGCLMAVRADAKATQRSAQDPSPATPSPLLAADYGANGRYAMETVSVENPAFARQPVTIFLPKGTTEPRPAIFFAHGYGPNRWQNYSALIQHIVSRGYILVYSTYPALFATNHERYDSLWAGFAAAVAHLGNRMDLTRVSFVGHSFGGGAVPALAWRGFVQQGWGKAGAMMMILAPWYAYQITTDQWRSLPPQVHAVVEVYDRDNVNDHRMAIDLFNHSAASTKFYFLVRSPTVDGSLIKADHATPGRNPSLLLKQAAVFRPFDALADWTFAGSEKGRQALAEMGRPAVAGVYQPLTRETQPAPTMPSGDYRFAWDNPKNPRAQPAP